MAYLIVMSKDLCNFAKFKMIKLHFSWEEHHSLWQKYVKCSTSDILGTLCYKHLFSLHLLVATQLVNVLLKPRGVLATFTRGGAAREDRRR